MKAQMRLLFMWSWERSVILMKEKNPFNLDVVSVRLVKDAPIMSGAPNNEAGRCSPAFGKAFV